LYKVTLRGTRPDWPLWVLITGKKLLLNSSGKNPFLTNKFCKGTVYFGIKQFCLKINDLYQYLALVFQALFTLFCRMLFKSAVVLNQLFYRKPEIFK